LKTSKSGFQNFNFSHSDQTAYLPDIVIFDGVFATIPTPLIFFTVTVMTRLWLFTPTEEKQNNVPFQITAWSNQITISII
jgi:hypothetical protein